MILTNEMLARLKNVKLPGELPLTHKPVLPDIVLFENRPKEFLHDLRRKREALSFTKGPSKAKKRDIVEGTDSRKTKNTGKRVSKNDIATALSKVNPEHQELLAGVLKNYGKKK